MDFPFLRSCVIIGNVAVLVMLLLMLAVNNNNIVEYSATLSLVVNLAGILTLWWGLCNHAPERRKPWRWFLWASIFLAFGDAYWAYNDEILDLDYESPNFCDLIYFFSNVFCGGALVLYLRQLSRGKLHFRPVAFDITLSLIASMGLMYNFAIAPILNNAKPDLLLILVTASYPVMSIIYLLLLFVLFFATDNRIFFTRVNVCLIAAYLLMLATDNLFMLSSAYEYELSVMVDPLFPTCFMLIAIASLFPEHELTMDDDLSENTPERFWSAALDYMRILLPYIFTLAILILVGVHYNLLDVVFLWGLLLVLLLSLRQVYVLVKNRYLLIQVRENEKQLQSQNDELNKLNAKILYDAQVDFLTKLYNRRYIDQKLRELGQDNTLTQSMGILLIDVDFFKHVNDTYGHQVGDDVLAGVAAEIRAVSREHDVGGRYGGDEFIMLLPDTDSSTAGKVAAELEDRIHTAELLGKYNVTLSIGCAAQEFVPGDTNVTKLLKKADDALYVAKENGRNQYVVYGEKKEVTAKNERK